jgi:hypothetical protein
MTIHTLIRLGLAVLSSVVVLGASAGVAGARIPAPPTPRPTHLGPPAARAAQLRMTRGPLVAHRLVVGPRFE